MAEVLEHQPEPGAQPALPRARPAQVLEAGDHGRGHLLRAERGPVAFAGRQEVRHPVPDVRALREPRPQHARPERRWGSRYVALRTIETVLNDNLAEHPVAVRSEYSSCHRCRLPRNHEPRYVRALPDIVTMF